MTSRGGTLRNFGASGHKRNESFSRDGGFVVAGRIVAQNGVKVCATFVVVQVRGFGQTRDDLWRESAFLFRPTLKMHLVP